METMKSFPGAGPEMEKAKEGEGIFYGWWIVVAATLVLCAQGVMFYGFGILFPSILEEFKWSRALTSTIFSVQIATNSLFIILMGYLIDRFSPRLIISLGGLFLCVGYIVSSLTREIWHLYLFFGIIVGMGASSMYVPPITVVTRWFEEKRGLALGIVVTGIGIGGFIGSPFLNLLIQSFGWRTALSILGVLIGVWVFIAAMILIGRPEEKGLQPYGAAASLKLHDQESSHILGDRPASSETGPNLNWDLWPALKTRAFLILFVMFFFAEVSLLGVMPHLFTYATESGIKNHIVSWAYGLIGATSLAGKVGIGALSDRTGRKAAFILSFALKGTAFLLLLSGPSVFSLYLFAALLGLSYGGWTPLFPATLGDYFGLNSMGKIFSILTLNFLLGGTCGPVLAGWIFDRVGSYFIAFVIFSLICYLAAILALFLKAPTRN